MRTAFIQGFQLMFWLMPIALTSAWLTVKIYGRTHDYDKYSSSQLVVGGVLLAPLLEELLFRLPLIVICLIIGPTLAPFAIVASAYFFAVSHNKDKPRAARLLGHMPWTLCLSWYVVETAQNETVMYAMIVAWACHFMHNAVFIGIYVIAHEVFGYERSKA